MPFPRMGDLAGCLASAQWELCITDMLMHSLIRSVANPSPAGVNDYAPAERLDFVSGGVANTKVCCVAWEHTICSKCKQTLKFHAL
jgi:hypothetical protein